MKKAWGLISCVVFLVGCQQDPLSGYGNDVKNAVPAGASTGPRKPGDPNLMSLDADDFMNFKEGVEGHFKVTGRVYDPSVAFTILVDGTLPPGATFTKDAKDPSLYNFVWTPPHGFTLGEIFRTFTITVAMVANTTPIEKRTQDVKVYVNKDFRVPQIVSVKGLKDPASGDPLPMQEGDTRNVAVEIEDLDADPTVPPEVAILSATSQFNAASFTKLNDSSPVPTNPGHFVYNFTVDTSGRELTKDETDYGLQFRSLSRFGIASPIWRETVQVYSKVAAPIISINDEIKMQIGRDNSYTFSISAPNGEGEPSVVFDNSCGDGFNSVACECHSTSDTSILACSLNWKIPPRIGPQDFTIHFTATNQGYEPSNKSFSNQATADVQQIIHVSR